MLSCRRRCCRPGWQSRPRPGRSNCCPKPAHRTRRPTIRRPMPRCCRQPPLRRRRSLRRSRRIRPRLPHLRRGGNLPSRRSAAPAARLRRRREGRTAPARARMGASAAVAISVAVRAMLCFVNSGIQFSPSVSDTGHHPCARNRHRVGHGVWLSNAAFFRTQDHIDLRTCKESKNRSFRMFRYGHGK